MGVTSESAAAKVCTYSVCVSAQISGAAASDSIAMGSSSVDVSKSMAGDKDGYLCSSDSDERCTNVAIATATYTGDYVTPTVGTDSKPVPLVSKIYEVRYLNELTCERLPPKKLDDPMKMKLMVKPDNYRTAKSLSGGLTMKVR